MGHHRLNPTRPLGTTFLALFAITQTDHGLGAHPEPGDDMYEEAELCSEIERLLPATRVAFAAARASAEVLIDKRVPSSAILGVVK